LRRGPDELVAARGLFAAGLYWFCSAALRGPAAAFTLARYLDLPDLRAMPGGLLVVSNHQSFLDPVLIGIAANEPLFFLARQDLFEIPGFGALIYALGARPVARGRADATALKTVLRILREGGKMLLFPEGTRSADGELGEFKAGVASIALRSGVPVLPACVEGGFRCWPRTRLLPRPGRVAVAYGEVIRPHGESAAELNREIRARIGALQAALRRQMGRDEGGRRQ
jgi:1-acyl-sn-glycerol-3-phosphate acyltransferase